METLINKKRKKRKTRRCLDELRKKTHQTNDVCSINKNIAKPHKNKSNCVKNNYITNNRLTLLNKAVRSETITRLQLSELEGKKLTSNKDRETIISNLRVNVVSNGQHKSNKILLGKRDTHISEDNSEILSPKINNNEVSSEIDTPKSVVLFSPDSQNGQAINTQLDSQLEISLISSSTPSTINTNYKSDTNDDVMDIIELFIEQDYPQFLKIVDSNVMKTKAELTKLCLENESKSEVNEDTLSTEEYLSPDVPTIQKTRDYIDYSLSQCSDSITSGINEPSPTESNSSFSIHIPSASSMASAVFDTPEYSYYPHRLN
ncbi:jg8422 [Pararge aegeria aegeria]|uniref:Jg8422 protein n=1 Tax=Pararge aegeria aegeria TaxID=348720 RepID=A0A8S4SNW5_9NEOP|nr:jg8422 [Pararge aegeria aegeria]